MISMAAISVWTTRVGEEGGEEARRRRGERGRRGGEGGAGKKTFLSETCVWVIILRPDWMPSHKLAAVTFRANLLVGFSHSLSTLACGRNPHDCDAPWFRRRSMHRYTFSALSEGSTFCRTSAKCFTLSEAWRPPFHHWRT